MVYKMQAIYGKLSMRGLHKSWKLLLYIPMNEWMNESFIYPWKKLNLDIYKNKKV